jgi:hypothetical protein
VKGPPIEPLQADIAALLEREKNAYPEDVDAKHAVFARVEMALALGGATLGATGSGAPGSAPPAGGGHAAVGTRVGSASAAVAKGAVTGKIVAIGLASFVAGGVAGGAAVKQTMQAPANRDAFAVATTWTATARLPESLPSLPAASASAPLAASAPPSETPPATPPGNPSASTARPASSVGDLTRERELLDAARAALDRGRPNDAVAAAREHAQKWPRGYLAEEREVVLIQGLVAAGNQQEAEHRAAQFHRTFPKSILGPAVDAAVRLRIP